MSKIAPGGDNISDASQQTAQRMVEESRKERAAREKPRENTGGTSDIARLSFADKKFHVPETPADYEKRVREDRELRGILGKDN